MGFCEQCGAWLGRAQHEEDSIDQFELWCASALGDIAASLSKIQRLATRDLFANQVGRAVTLFAGGSRRKFCLEVGLVESALQHLLSGNKRPTLSLWMEIAYGLGVPPTTLLERGFGDCLSAPCLHRLPRKIIQRAPRGKLSAVQKRAIEKRLICVAESPDGSISVLELAKELGVSRSCLRYSWPNLCSRISAAYLARRNAVTKERLALQCIKLDEVMDALLARGIYPSQQLINEALVDTGISLLNPNIRALYRRRLENLKSRWLFT